MRSLLSVLTVALALVLPASAAFARPAEERAGSSGAPQAVGPATSPADGGGEPLGYVAVGLGGFALGAAGFAGASSARRSRRVLEA
jgi:hypothetical protein